MRGNINKCRHQWSVWQSTTGSSEETRWCHKCNLVEGREKANHYQEFGVRIRPRDVALLPKCENGACGARKGEPCLDSNGEKVYVFAHACRNT